MAKPTEMSVFRPPDTVAHVRCLTSDEATLGILPEEQDGQLPTPVFEHRGRGDGPAMPQGSDDHDALGSA